MNKKLVSFLVGGVFWSAALHAQLHPLCGAARPRQRRPRLVPTPFALPDGGSRVTAPLPPHLFGTFVRPAPRLG